MGYTPVIQVCADQIVVEATTTHPDDDFEYVGEVALSLPEALDVDYAGIGATAERGTALENVVESRDARFWSRLVRAGTEAAVTSVPLGEALGRRVGSAALGGIVGSVALSVAMAYGSAVAEDRLREIVRDTLFDGKENSHDLISVPIAMDVPFGTFRRRRVRVTIPTRDVNLTPEALSAVGVSVLWRNVGIVRYGRVPAPLGPMRGNQREHDAQVTIVQEINLGQGLERGAFIVVRNSWRTEQFVFIDDNLVAECQLADHRGLRSSQGTIA